MGGSPGGGGQGYLDVLGGQDNSNPQFGGPPGPGGPEQDWNFDPNEPRYCICNQVSYGDMVACDNDDVSTSYFWPFLASFGHFGPFMVIFYPFETRFHIETWLPAITTM